MRLHGQVGRTHDALPQVIHAMQVMAVVIAHQHVGHVPRERGVDARHHEHAMQLVRHGRGEEGVLRGGAPACARGEHRVPLLERGRGEELGGVVRDERDVGVEFDDLGGDWGALVDG